MRLYLPKDIKIGIMRMKSCNFVVHEAKNAHNMPQNRPL